MTVRDSDTLKSYFNLSKVITPSNYADLVDTIFAQSTSGELGEHTHDNLYVQRSIPNVVSAVHTFDPSTYSAPFILGAYAQGQTVVGLKADQLNRNISVSGLGLSGGGILNSDRNISLASSSNPGTSAAILASDSAGKLTLEFLGVTTGIASSLTPTLTDTYDLGSSIKLWRKGWLSELDTILFAETTATLVGGWLIIGKDEGKCVNIINPWDSIVDFGKVMNLNDFIVFRSSLQVEYMQILSFVSGFQYVVSRNLDGTGPNTWIEGSVYLVLGHNGDGRIELNSYDTPRIQILSQGNTYNAQTEQLRLGDLNGNWGYAVQWFGLAVGEYASGKANMTWDPGNGLRLRTYGTTVIHLDNSGAAYFAGVMTIGTSGGIYQGTGTFGTPTTGLKIWNDSGVGRIAGYNTGVLQWYAATDGMMYAGGGKVLISANGIGFTDTSSTISRLYWKYDGNTVGWTGGDYAGAGTTAVMWMLSSRTALDSWDYAATVVGSTDSEFGTRSRIDLWSDGEIDVICTSIVRALTLEGTHYTTAGMFIPLTTPLTSTSWDGDSYSTTGKTAIDLSAVFGAPAEIRAILVHTSIRDSGSAVGDYSLTLSPESSSGLGFYIRVSGLPNDYWHSETHIIPCNASGDIYYQIVASGTSTMDVIIRIWGYWI